MPTDAELLEYLEAELKEWPILLHNLGGSSDPSWPRNYHGRGLGLLQGRRTLRQAIAAMMKGDFLKEIESGAKAEEKE